jgi:murein DD-endopeptidase MepM/ murein hydrolase activator NlpD
MLHGRIVSSAVLLIACGGDAHVINSYKSSMGMVGGFRVQPHSGVDFEGGVGSPVLAADDGLVVSHIEAPAGGGTCILLEHHCARCKPSVYFTSYCHLHRVHVRPGQPVVRGQEIAEIGGSGRTAGPIPHLHFSMCNFPCVAASADGDFVGIMDPMPYDVGCFRKDGIYTPHGKPILTHPIVCKGD